MVPVQFVIISSISVFLVWPSQSEESECIKEGIPVNYSCAVMDETGEAATLWTGSSAVFDCLGGSTISNGRIFLLHLTYGMPSPTVECGDSVFGQLTNRNSSFYESTVTITAHYKLNHGTIRCLRFGGTETVLNVTLRIGVVPEPPVVSAAFAKIDGVNKFTVAWSVLSDTVGGIGGYETEINGRNCGRCNNIGNVTTNELTCSSWVPTGQVCTVAVRTVTADCGFESETPSLKHIYLKYPESPTLHRVTPTYSTEGHLESLLLVLFLNEGTEDDNGLPVSYEASIHHLQSGNTCLKQIHLGYCNDDLCELEVDLQIDCQHIKNVLKVSGGEILIFASASTDIGESSVRYPNPIDLVNRLVELKVLAEDQYNLVITEFSDTYDRISSSIQYGTDLTERKHAYALNDSSVCLAITLHARTYFIVTADGNATGFPINIKGIFEGSPSNQLDTSLISTGAIAAVSAVLNGVFLLVVLVHFRVSCLRRSRMVTISVLSPTRSTNSQQQPTNDTENAEQEIGPVYEEVGSVETTQDPKTDRNESYTMNTIANGEMIKNESYDVFTTISRQTCL